MIQKARVVFQFGDIIEEVQSLQPSNYDDIMKLDHDLREIQATVPPHLRMRPIDESARDSASLIMQRYHIELLLLKSQCVLHRKFLGLARENPRYAYSRRTAIDASMTMLQHQVSLHHESQPGGRLRNVKWFSSSLTTQQFLLAGMIVCLDLYHTQEAERHGRRASSDMAFDWNDDRRASMIAAIDSSVHIWEGLRDHSMEAFKAHATLTVMLQKLREHEGLRQRQQHHRQQGSVQQQQSYAQPPQPFPITANGVGGGVDGMTDDDPNVAPEHSAAMTLGMLSTGALTPNAGMMFDGGGGSGKGYGGAYGDASQQQNSGLTPNYSGPGNDGTAGPANAQSPFSQLFGGGMGFQGMDALGGVGGNLDWVSFSFFVSFPP